MLDVLIQKWWAVALRGILAIVFGIVALVFPGATLVSLAVVFGAYAFVAACSPSSAAFGRRGREASGMYSKGPLELPSAWRRSSFPALRLRPWSFSSACGPS